MTVELDRNNLLAGAPGTELPAISEDGSRFVELVDDVQDFTGFPVHTLIVWSRTGKQIASISTAATELDPSTRKATANDRAAVTKAAAALAGTKWRPLDRATPCGDDNAIQLPGGLTISLDVDHQTLVTSKPHIVTKLVAPGFNAETKGPCGSFARLKSVFGGVTEGAIVVALGPQYGGDLCSGDGTPTVVVRLR